VPWYALDLQRHPDGPKPLVRDFETARELKRGDTLEYDGIKWRVMEVALKQGEAVRVVLCWPA
jgi:hypothetical protein